MLDRDLAQLYQVETKVLNQAVKRNMKRFPDYYIDNGYVDIDTAKNVADKVIEMLQKFETEIMNIVELKSYHI